jgi:hypothetical protein
MKSSKLKHKIEYVDSQGQKQIQNKFHRIKLEK